MRVVVYRITGRQGWLRVPERLCPECDLTVAAVRAAVHAAGLDELEVQVRPWLCHLGEALRLGAWHPPAVAVDGVLLSQGRVPDVGGLAAQLAARAGEGRGGGDATDPSAARGRKPRGGLVRGSGMR